LGQRIGVGKVFRDEGLVDDGHVQAARPVLLRELPATLDLDAEGLEVPGRYHAEACARSLGGVGDGRACDLERHPEASANDRHAG